MKIFQCLVGFSDGHVGICDGIEFNGKLWLVTRWLRHKTEPHSKPERIIRFDNLPHQRTSGEAIEFQNVLIPAPESVTSGDVPAGIEYIDLPDILVPSQSVIRQ